MPLLILICRSILSEISKIFHQLGLAAPVVILKLFLRELWKRSCNWGEPFDVDLHEKCYHYASHVRV